MLVHGTVIFRHIFKEINMVLNLCEQLDPCLDHREDFISIHISCEHFLHIRHSHLPESLIVHSLDIFPVHPCKFRHIKDSRSLGHMMIVKSLFQFFQRKDLSFPSRTPSEQSHEVYDRLRQISCLQQILERRMSAPFAQLLVFLIRDERAVYIDRFLPSECIIEPVIFRRR